MGHTNDPLAHQRSKFAAKPQPDRVRGIDAPQFSGEIPVQNVSEGKITPDDNVLTQFDAVTYKWTLYLADPQLHNGPEATNTFQDGTVIAESGNAGRFFIENVTIDQLVSVNSLTRNMPFTKFNFTIVEPKGISFMDNLLSAVNLLKIPNHIKAPYYLQLDFWAQNADGVPVIVPEGTRKWSIQIFDMQTSVRADGSTYVFDAIATDDIGTMNYTAIAPFSISIREAITIEHFFQQYERTMNDFHGLYKDILYQEIDKISFIIDDEIKDLKFGGGASDPKRNASTLTQNDDEKLINLPKGFDIVTLVENLMVATPEWEPKVQMPVNADRTIKRDSFTRLWTIETEVEYLNYDIRRQDYARHYKFNIKPFTVVRSAGDVDRGDIQFQEGRFTKLVDTFEIRKIYHYIFTGLNTEVLNFDLDLSLMWYNEMPIHMGLNTHAAGDSGRRVSTDGVENLPQRRADLTKDLLDSRKVLTDINKANLESNLPPPTDEISVISEAAGQERALVEELNNLPNGAAPGRTIAEVNNITNQINAARGTIVNPRFIEDIDTLNLSNSFRASDTPEPNTGAIIYSLRFDPAREDLTKMFAVEGEASGTRAFMATYLNYYVNAEMVNLNLEIRGDPWWIGRGKFERRSLGIPIIPNTDIQDSKAMDPTYRDNLLVLNMKSPKPENPHGLYEVEDNDLYTGIYQIYRVESTFDGGLFTQKLSGIKEALTDLRVLRTKI